MALEERRSPKTTNEQVHVFEADLGRARDANEVLALTAAFALDPMGNGGPLAPEVLGRLIDGLRSHPTTLIFLAHVGENAVGIATCFRGFSTFSARPLVNISDLAVLPEWRGMGIGKRILAAVEDRARELGCCKVTLEVQENNQRARTVYQRAGFTRAVYGETAGGVLYYWKNL